MRRQGLNRAGLVALDRGLGNFPVLAHGISATAFQDQGQSAVAVILIAQGCTKSQGELGTAFGNQRVVKIGMPGFPLLVIEGLILPVLIWRARTAPRTCKAGRNSALPDRSFRFRSTRSAQDSLPYPRVDKISAVQDRSGAPTPVAQVCSADETPRPGGSGTSLRRLASHLEGRPDLKMDCGIRAARNFRGLCRSARLIPSKVFGDACFSEQCQEVV